MSLIPFFALFALALLGWWWWKRHPIMSLLVAIFLLNTAIIGFTYDEWNGRFLVPLWPVILMCAAMGFEAGLERLRERRRIRAILHSSAPDPSG